MQIYMSNEEAANALNNQLQNRAWNINKQQMKKMDQIPVINLGKGIAGIQTGSTPSGVQIFDALNSGYKKETEPTASAVGSVSSGNPIMQNNSLSAFNSLLPLIGIGGLAALIGR